MVGSEMLGSALEHAAIADRTMMPVRNLITLFMLLCLSELEVAVIHHIQLEFLVK
jgi:hypothetical protein